MDKNIEDEVKMIDAHVQGEPEEEIYHVYTVPGGVVILRQGEVPEDQTVTVIDSLPKTGPETHIPSTPLPTKQHSEPVTTALISVLLLAMFVPLFCLLVQFSMLFNPYTVTFTLLTKSQQLSITGTLQLGRVLNPITISQSQTVATTGKGHQAAATAVGNITFYNGLSSEQSIAAGTTITGNSGEQIITDQDANIPPESQDIPPSLGYATVSAHAISPGSRGNIPAGDINQPCCATAIKAVNTTSFHGGQDERNFQFVTKTDITNTEDPLKATLSQSVTGALQGQVKTDEAFTKPSCTTTTTSDHRQGEEATQVKVTVSETCSAVAYNQDSLQAKVTDLLNHQAAEKLGSGYSLLGNPQITVTSATTSKQVLLSLTSVSTWVYALNMKEQNHMKKIIAGRNTPSALQLLKSLPGIKTVLLHFAGFGDDSRIPKDTRYIHLVIFEGI